MFLFYVKFNIFLDFAANPPERRRRNFNIFIDMRRFLR